VVLAARGLARAGAFAKVTLEARAGEILGVGGLLESGKEALGRVLAGLLRPTGGTIELDGRPVTAPTTAALVARGLGYVPAERLAEGMIPAFPISWNMSLASGADLMAGPLGTWNSTRERELAQRFIGLLRIGGGTPGSPCARLSGGNQQKVVLARWLCRDLRVLILDNPTRGVDAGGKEEIYGLLRDLTDRGVAILLITDELLELIGLSDRVAVMRRGRIAGLVDAIGRKPDEQAMIRLMLGGGEAGAVPPDLGHPSPGLAA
jgi:ribose transport system ATP-binding protein